MRQRLVQTCLRHVCNFNIYLLFFLQNWVRLQKLGEVKLLSFIENSGVAITVAGSPSPTALVLGYVRLVGRGVTAL